MAEAEEISDSLYEKILTKLRAFSGCEAVLIALPEKNLFKIAATSGELPPAIAGARFICRDNLVIIKFPGNLGEEEVGKLNEKSGIINFKSSVTRLECTIMPLNLRNKAKGILIFTSKEAHNAPTLPLSSVALFIETVVALIDSSGAEGDVRYKDKTTGLLRYECFADSYETEIERSERYQQEMTLFSVKINFCQDAPEEEKGILQKAAAVALKQSLRRLDLMFSGATECESMAILTETSSEVAEIVAQRVQKSFTKQVEKSELTYKDTKMLFIGSATYPTDATHGDGLLEKSREALLQAEKDNKEFVSYSLI